MGKVIDAGIEFNDREAAREILKELQAPVTDQNIANLKIIIEELGEMFAESYDKMLREHTNEKLAIYGYTCECGQPITIDVSLSDIFEGAVKV